MNGQMKKSVKKKYSQKKIDWSTERGKIWKMQKKFKRRGTW